MRRLLALILFAGVPLSPASAEELAWMGPGAAASCSEYKALKDEAEGIRSYFYAWAQGFMSGLNTPLLTPKTSTNLGGTSTDDQQAYIDKYCDGHPKAYYVEAVLSLFEDMRDAQNLPSWQEPSD